MALPGKRVEPYRAGMIPATTGGRRDGLGFVADKLFPLLPNDITPQRVFHHHERVGVFVGVDAKPSKESFDCRRAIESLAPMLIWCGKDDMLARSELRTGRKDPDP